MRQKQPTQTKSIFTLLPVKEDTVQKGLTGPSKYNGWLSGKRVKHNRANFMDLVVKCVATGCWNFQVINTAHKYGNWYCEGSSRLAHRAAYEYFVGDIPDGMHVLHECDNPSCVNPAHLFLGTHQENMQDMSRKGRQAHGSNSGQAKLTERQVRHIRKSNKSQRELGRQFGVAHTTIGCIQRGTTWQILLN